VFLAPGPSARTRHSLLPAGILISAWMVPPVYEWNHVVGLLILVPLIRNRLDAPARSDRVGELGTDGRSAPVTNHLFPSLRSPTPPDMYASQCPSLRSHPPRRPLYLYVRSSQIPPDSYAPLRFAWRSPVATGRGSGGPDRAEMRAGMPADLRGGVALPGCCALP
jgi:hypothetical protein